MSDFVKDARIALLNAALEIKKPEFDTNIRIDDPAINRKLSFSDLLTITALGKGSLSNHLEKRHRLSRSR